MDVLDSGALLQPGERVTHQEYGQGVVLDPARDGYLRAFFGVGERRVPVAWYSIGIPCGNSRFKTPLMLSPPLRKSRN